MFLAIDIGNSTMKLAIYKADKLINYLVRNPKSFNPNMLDNSKPSAAAISSVVPSDTKKISQSIGEHFKISPYIIHQESKLNINIDYDNPASLGIDRICSAEGAVKLSNDLPGNDNRKGILVIDFGTATTINFIGGKNTFSGGIILPGFRLMVNALSRNTAQLPEITIQNYSTFIGKNTKAAIASGIINSTISLIEKTMENLWMEGVGKLTVYATGGNYSFFGPHLSINHTFVEDLVLRGVKAIYERNNVAK